LDLKVEKYPLLKDEHMSETDWMSQYFHLVSLNVP